MCVYSLPYGFRVWIIQPIENSEFCACCTRLRVTGDGYLKPCLMVTDNLLDVLTSMRNGANDDELKELFVAAVKRRQPYHKSVKN